MPGWSRASSPPAASRFSRTIRTWSGRIPAAWYQVHLKAPGLDVTGVSLPGVPGVIIGHNQRIAWGVTNLGFDVQDLYLEKIDPQNRPLSVSRPGGAGALGIGMDSREGRAAGGVPAVGDAARPGGCLRKRPLLRAALGGGGAGWIRVSFSGFESRRQLEGVHRCAGALSRPRPKLRLCRRGRQHRVSGHGPASDPQELRRRRAGGRQRAAISNGMASFLSISCRRSTIRRAAGS